MISCVENRRNNQDKSHIYTKGECIYPVWIQGTWQNLTESNTNSFEYWRFSNDSVYVAFGFPMGKSNTTSLLDKYSEYKLNTIKNDSIFKLIFIKDNDSIGYEFIKQSFDWSESAKNSFTYSFERNGVVERECSTSCNLTFQKLNRLN